MPFRDIRKQVEQFSHNVSRIMIRFQFYRHIPDLEPAVSHLDPRQRNHPDNFETRRKIGGNLSRRVRLPAMSLYNWVNRGTAWDARIYSQNDSFPVPPPHPWSGTCSVSFRPQTNEITRTTPRQEGILVVICQGVSVSLPCICTSEWTEARPDMLEFIDGESIFAPKGFGRGKKL